MDFSADLFILPIHGGATPYKILTDKVIKSKDDLDTFHTAVILVKDEAKADTIDTVSELDEDVTGILALNGPATQALLDELDTQHPVLPYIFENKDKITDLKGILPEQIVFMIFFGQLFFSGHVSGGITTPIAGTFKDKYMEAVAGLEKKGTDNRKVFDVDNSEFETYFNTLQGKYIDESRRISFSDFRNILISGPDYVLKYFAKGELALDTNASTLKSRSTNFGMRGLPLPNNSNNGSSVGEEINEEEDRRVEFGLPAKAANAPEVPAKAPEVPAKAPEVAAPVQENEEPVENNNASSVGSTATAATGNPISSVRTTRKNAKGKNKAGKNLELQNLVFAEPVNPKTRKRNIVRGKLIDHRKDKKGKNYFTVRKLKKGSNAIYNRSRPFEVTQPYIQKMEKLNAINEVQENLENEA